MRKHIRRSMNSLLSIPGANKFILDGYLFRNFPQVDEILKKNPVFFDYFDSSRPDGMTGVLIDYHEVGILGAKYLIENGCRHPLLIIGDSPFPRNRYSPEYFAVHKAKKIINGYSEVLRENAYLSRTVEVQENQKVVDTGLYGIVRHPMYAVTLLLFLSIWDNLTE